MAGELTVTASMAFKKGSTDEKLESKDKRIDVAGTVHVKQKQVVGTTAEAVDLGDVAVGGYVLFRNNDPTNFVELRLGATGVDFCRLKPGDVALFRISPDATGGNALNVIADTAAVELEYFAIPA